MPIVLKSAWQPVLITAKKSARYSLVKTVKNDCDQERWECFWWPSFYRNILGFVITEITWSCFKHLFLNYEKGCTVGMLAAMDVAIARVVKALKQRGLYDNTIIIFSSDVRPLQWVFLFLIIGAWWLFPLITMTSRERVGLRVIVV